MHIILLIENYLQQQIHYNGNVFGNKCCRCNEGSLYTNTPPKVATPPLKLLSHPCYRDCSRVDPRRVRQDSFEEIDHEKFSTAVLFFPLFLCVFVCVVVVVVVVVVFCLFLLFVFLCVCVSLLLAQEYAQVLVNRLEDLGCPGKCG